MELCLIVVCIFSNRRCVMTINKRFLRPLHRMKVNLASKITFSTRGLLIITIIIILPDFDFASIELSFSPYRFKVLQLMTCWSNANRCCRGLAPTTLPRNCKMRMSWEKLIKICGKRETREIKTTHVRFCQCFFFGEIFVFVFSTAIRYSRTQLQSK